jgi:hypothetical protein
MFDTEGESVEKELIESAIKYNIPKYGILINGL